MVLVVQWRQKPNYKGYGMFFFLMENTDKNDSVMVKPLFKSVFAYKSPRT